MDIDVLCLALKNDDDGSLLVELLVRCVFPIDLCNTMKSFISVFRFVIISQELSIYTRRYMSYQESALFYVACTVLSALLRRELFRGCKPLTKSACDQSTLLF